MHDRLDAGAVIPSFDTCLPRDLFVVDAVQS